MKETYEKTTISVIEFEKEDVITTSAAPSSPSSSRRPSDELPVIWNDHDA